MLGYLLSAYFFILPFQFAVPVATATEIPLARILAILLMVVFVIESFTRRSFLLPPLLFTSLLATFLVLSGFSVVWAEDKEFALRKLIFLLNLFPLVVVLYAVLREGKWRDTVLRSFLVGVGTAALLGLTLFFAQFVFGIHATFHFILERILPFFLGEALSRTVAEYPSLLVNIGGETLLRVTAFFPDPHVASLYFGMAGFLALGLALRDRRRLYFVLVLLLFLAHILTFSRGGYVGLVAGSLIFFILHREMLTALLKPKALGIFTLILLIAMTLGQPILSRFISSFTIDDASSVNRLELWNTASKHIAERPLLGTGIGNYVVAVLPGADFRTPYYAHNLYLDIAVELGLLGLMCFLLLFLATLLPLRAGYRKKANPLSLGILAALTLYLAHSLFETALFSVHVTSLLLFCFALALSHEEQAPLATIE